MCFNLVVEVDGEMVRATDLTLDDVIIYLEDSYRGRHLRDFIAESTDILEGMRKNDVETINDIVITRAR